MRFSRAASAGSFDISIAHVSHAAVRSNDSLLLVDYSPRMQGNDHSLGTVVSSLVPYPASNISIVPLLEQADDILVTEEFTTSGEVAVPLWYRHAVESPVYAPGATTVTLRRSVGRVRTLTDLTFVGAVPSSSGKTPYSVIRNTVRAWFDYGTGTIPLPMSQVWFDGDGSVIVSDAFLTDEHVPVDGTIDLIVRFGVVVLPVTVSGTREGSPYAVECHSLDWIPSDTENAEAKGTRFGVAILSEYPDQLEVGFTTMDDYGRTSSASEWTSGCPLYAMINESESQFSTRAFSTNPFAGRVYAIPKTGDIGVSWYTGERMIILPRVHSASKVAVTLRDTTSPSSIHCLIPQSVSFELPWYVSVTPGQVIHSSETVYPSTGFVRIESDTSSVTVGVVYDLVAADDTTASLLLGFVSSSGYTAVTGTWRVRSIAGNTLNFDDSMTSVLSGITAGDRLIFQTQTARSFTVAPQTDPTFITDSVIVDSPAFLQTPVIRSRYPIRISRGSVSLPVESVNTETGTITTGAILDPGERLTVSGVSYRNDRVLYGLDLNVFTRQSGASFLDPMVSSFIVVLAPDHVGTPGKNLFLIPTNKFSGNTRIIPTYDELDAEINAPRYVTGTTAYAENAGWYETRYEARLGMISGCGVAIPPDLFVVTMGTVFEPATARDIRLEILGMIETITPLGREGSAYTVEDMRIYGGGYLIPEGACHDVSRFDGEISDMNAVVRVSVPSDMIHEMADRLSDWDPDIVNAPQASGLAYDRAVDIVLESAEKHRYIGAEMQVEIKGMYYLGCARCMSALPARRGDA